jgi:hypothetical protein
MSGDKLRQQIVFEAARLMFQRQESEYRQAKVRAARSVCRQRLRPSELPTNHEIREELQRLSSVYSIEIASEPLPDGSNRDPAESVDRFRGFRSLLIPLAHIDQDRRSHPEGDVLYHSLQVFKLAREAFPYDEEFLLAALLHDVGKGIDAHDHVAAGLHALADTISPRTAWLIENQSLGRSFLDGTIGIRARNRLQRSDDYEALIVLAKCDSRGRVSGASAPELDEALAYLQDLAEANG